jgi:hypothetical protein
MSMGSNICSAATSTKEIQCASPTVARPVVSSPTPAIHLGYGETMASIGQGVVGEAHCISLVEVAAEQMLEPIDIVPALQRGWAWWI